MGDVHGKHGDDRSEGDLVAANGADSRPEDLEAATESMSRDGGKPGGRDGQEGQ